MLSAVKPEGSDADYAAVLEALDSIDWERAAELGVTKIRPTGKHAELNCFPGQRGFVGERFPVGGIMLVANNFDNLSGWLDYEANPDFCDISPTWAKLLNCVLPNTDVPLAEFGSRTTRSAS